MGIEPKQRENVPYLLDDGEQSHDRQQVGEALDEQDGFKHALAPSEAEPREGEGCQCG